MCRSMMAFMVRFGRIVLVALLVAMIPAKGFAAARMLFCGLASERAAMMGQSQSGMSGGAHHATHRADAQPPCHVTDAGTTGHGTHSPGSGSASAGGAGQDDSAPNHDTACSVCAVCSSATVIAGAAAMHSPLDASHRATPALLVRFAGYIPPTLDRPPLG